MTADVEAGILTLLLARMPNWESGRGGLEDALAALHSGGDIERAEDPGGDTYFRLARREGLPVRRTIRIGDTEIPRLLSDSSPRFLPEHFNDAVEQLAE